ncbi:MAG TPA: prolyl oligopeptidase family serine peptidase [Sphingobacteriaceae bacterium]|nr:prolyl oligopeptidase family serine peptidase [Sphingobacteriaceae bacterium]
MKRLAFSLLVFSLILIGACKKDTPLEKPINIQEIMNVEYGPDPSQKLDVYFPETRTAKTKTIVFVHGKSWHEGDKSRFTDLAKFFRDKGYATVTINYHLVHHSASTAHNSANTLNHVNSTVQHHQVNDLGRAIDFLVSKAVEWKISPENFGIVGDDTGAHIGLLYTYGFNTKNKVKAVVSMAGPTNLTDLINEDSNNSSIECFVGSTLQANPTAYRNASPIFHVKSTSKPTLLFHGKRDNIVPEKQARDLKAKLDEFQIPNKLVVYEDTGHEVLNVNHLASFVGDVELFFKENIK